MAEEISNDMQQLTLSPGSEDISRGWQVIAISAESGLPEEISQNLQKLTLSPGFSSLPFDLRHCPSKFFESGSFNPLFDVFLWTLRLDFDGVILLYYLSELPPKPWPKKIAGVPCYLTASEDDKAPVDSIRCRRLCSSITVAEDLDLRDNESAADLIFDLVRDYFDSNNLPITEIQFWGQFIVFVLKDEAAGLDHALPWSVAHCDCYYLLESEMARPRELSMLRPKQSAFPLLSQTVTRSAEIPFSADIFLDIPFSGSIEGTRGPLAQLRVLNDDPFDTNETWIRCRWDYMGQDSHEVMDHVCSSAIWDQNQHLTGVAGYVPQCGPFVDWCLTILDWASCPHANC